jgi:hypothetical protein
MYLLIPKKRVCNPPFRLFLEFVSTLISNELKKKHYYSSKTAILSTSQVEPEVLVPVYLKAMRVLADLNEVNDCAPLATHAQEPPDKFGDKDVQVAEVGFPDV